MDKKKEKALKFSFKTRLLLMVLCPTIVVLFVVSSISLYYLQKLGIEEIQSELYAFASSTLERYNAWNQDDYSYEDGVFKKGDLVLSENYTVIDKLKESTNIDTVLFYQDTIVSCSFIDENGDRVIGEKANSDIVSQVLDQGETIYVETAINGTTYCGVYAPLTQPSNGEIIGMLYTGTPMESVKAAMNSAVKTILLIAVLLLLLDVVVVILLANHMTKALLHSAKEINKLAHGVLHYESNPAMENRSDEIGEVAIAAKNVSEKMKNVVGEILNTCAALNTFSIRFQEAFKNITQNVGDVDIAVGEIAKGATSQASETMSANTGVMDIGRAIDGTIENVNILGGSMDKMKEYNGSVQTTLSELSGISSQTKGSVGIVYDRTSATNDSAKEIQAATNLITEIASQTNLLSLNASIEAARAGEMGKGFAVVADEIRKLSEQSKDSAAKIEHIVDGLLENSNLSVTTMNEMTNVIEKQNTMIDNTKEVFNFLNEEIESVSTAVENISAQTKDLESIKSRVLTIVDNLAAIAQQNAASAQETNASMEEVEQTLKECLQVTDSLLEIAAKLNENTSIFTLEKEAV